MSEVSIGGQSIGTTGDDVSFDSAPDAAGGVYPRGVGRHLAGTLRRILRRRTQALRPCGDVDRRVRGANLGICPFVSSGFASTPFGTLGGQGCVQGPYFRTGPRPSGGASGPCDGNCAYGRQDLANASPMVVAGATIHAPVWARDPAHQDGFLPSNGLEVVACP